MQENFIHCILHIRRITTLHEGMRWPDIKRYGILIYRRDMANQRVTDEMPPNDLRYAIQIPRSVIVAGIQPNREEINKEKSGSYEKTAHLFFACPYRSLPGSLQQ